MAKKKFYVVWEGSTTGILPTWEECKNSIHGYSGAKYKSFKTLELAKKAYDGAYDEFKGKTFFETQLSKDELILIGKPDLNTVSVDAACSGNPGLMEYQCVDTKTKKLIFNQGPYLDSTNNIGEFLGLVHALAHMKKNNDNRPIYTDSKIAMGWVRKKKSKSKMDKTKNNAKVFDIIERAENWLEANEYDNKILKWETKAWGEIPADFGRK